MSEPSADVMKLLEGLDAGRQAWIEGRPDWGPETGFEQAEDMTILGPFGAAARADPVRQARVAADFGGGTGRCEVLKVIESGDLVVIVLIERNRVAFRGRSGSEPWVLRTTQVFRRDGTGWIRLHRHADPLVERRSLAETLSLLNGVADTL